MRPLERFAAEELVGGRECARIEFAEDVVDVDHFTVVDLELESGALEFRFEHGDIESGDVVTAEVAVVDVVVEFFGDDRKDRAIFHVVIGDAVDRGCSGRDRHFGIQPPDGTLRASVRIDFEDCEFDNAVALRHDSGTLDIEYDQRSFQFEFIAHFSLLLHGFRKNITLLAVLCNSFFRKFLRPCGAGLTNLWLHAIFI